MKKKTKQVGSMTAIVNPFTRNVSIRHIVGKETYDLELYFEDNDEWQGFDGVDKQYDMHYYYEDGAGFDLSVYPVIQGKKYPEPDTKNSIKVDVKIVYQILGNKKPITYICLNQ